MTEQFLNVALSPAAFKAAMTCVRPGHYFKDTFQMTGDGCYSVKIRLKAWNIMQEGVSPTENFSELVLRRVAEYKKGN